MFQETNNRRFFQGRYVMNHPFTEGNAQTCTARYMDSYGTGEAEDVSSEDIQTLQREIREVYRDYQFRTLPSRFEEESQNLARLTGWNIDTIRQRISDEVPQPRPSGWKLLHPPS